MFDNIDFKIQEVLIKLDDCARGYEARWGVGRLERIADVELCERFNRQYKKLMDAVCLKDYPSVLDIAEGCKRGWCALEEYALKKGEKKNPDYYMETRIGETDEVLRIYKNNTDASCPRDSGVLCMSLQEVSAIIGKTRKAVFYNDSKDNSSNSLDERVKSFNWKSGDSSDF